MADIKPPDLATRLAILRKRVQHDSIELADEPCAAKRSPSASTANVRALEGALIRVVAFSSLTGRPLDRRARTRGPRQPLPRAAPAAQPLDRRDPGCRRAPHFGLTLDELALLRAHRPHRLAPSGRDVPRSRAHRRVAAGDRRQFGGRDHTTVLHACRRTDRAHRSEDGSRRAVEKLSRSSARHR